MFYWVHSGREKREHRWSWFRCLGCHLSACDVWGRSAPCILICKSRNIGPICYMKIEVLQLDNTCKCPTRRLGAFPVFFSFFFFLTLHGMFLNPAWIDDPSLPSLPPKCRAENCHCYPWQIHAPFSCISDNTLQTEPYFQRRQQSLWLGTLETSLQAPGSFTGDQSVHPQALTNGHFPGSSRK